jgi:hypothetical protein
VPCVSVLVAGGFLAGLLCAAAAAATAAAPAAAIEVGEDEEDDDNDSSLGDDAASSTASLTSSIFEYRNIQGRTFHSDRHKAEYFTPNDTQQLESVDITHHYLMILLDNKLHLAPLEKTPERVLDIGTGSGRSKTLTFSKPTLTWQTQAFGPCTTAPSLAKNPSPLNANPSLATLLTNTPRPRSSAPTSRPSSPRLCPPT